MITVDFPPPVGPTIAAFWPGSITNETFFKTGVPLTYEKVTSLNSILMLSVSVMATGEFFSSDLISFSSIKAKRRSRQAKLSDSSVNTEERSLNGFIN